MLVFSIQARIRPIVIIMIGINFIIIGRINELFVNNIIHLIILPAKIDRLPRSIVGPIISIFSLILVNGLERFGPHNTAKLNRIE